MEMLAEADLFLRKIQQAKFQTQFMEELVELDNEFSKIEDPLLTEYAAQVGIQLNDSNQQNNNNKIQIISQLRDILFALYAHVIKLKRFLFKNRECRSKKRFLFLSHSGEEKLTYVSHLYLAICSNVINKEDIFFDYHSLTGAQYCEDSMWYNLLFTRVGVAVISRSFLSRKWPLRELFIFAVRHSHAKKLGVALCGTLNTEEREEADFQFLADFYDIETKECWIDYLKKIPLPPNPWPGGFRLTSGSLESDHIQTLVERIKYIKNPSRYVQPKIVFIGIAGSERKQVEEELETLCTRAWGKFSLTSVLNCSFDKFTDILKKELPDILHISGVSVDELFPNEDLIQVIQECSKRNHISLIYLNICGSSNLAETLLPFCRYTISISQSINRQNAAYFMDHFYLHYESLSNAKLPFNEAKKLLSKLDNTAKKHLQLKKFKSSSISKYNTGNPIKSIDLFEKRTEPAFQFRQQGRFLVGQLVDRILAKTNALAILNVHNKCILSGMSGAGKSVLAEFIAATTRFKSLPVIYVDIRPANDHTWAQFVKGFQNYWSYELNQDASGFSAQSDEFFKSLDSKVSLLIIDDFHNALKSSDFAQKILNNNHHKVKLLILTQDEIDDYNLGSSRVTIYRVLGVGG